MTDDEIEAFAEFIHDAAIQYANGHETDFRPVARRIAQASRRAALEEYCDTLTNVAAHGGDLNAAIGLIRSKTTET